MIIEEKDAENKTVRNYYEVDWDNCVEVLSSDANPENTLLDISKCRQEKGYDISHDCQNGVQDITKCMEGKRRNL